VLSPEAAAPQLGQLKAEMVGRPGFFIPYLAISIGRGGAGL
jgi:hypothetical protein